MCRMAASGEWRSLAADLPPGASAKFQLQCAGRKMDGFIVHLAGQYYAYVNRCPHVGTPLDLWPNEFFTEDARALICSTHGAVFEPTSGRCTAGPCVGDSLAALPVRREGDALVVGCPPR
jgi:nitrite reductase/ring-hydroxylating ferredoxin subunit